MAGQIGSMGVPTGIVPEDGQRIAACLQATGGNVAACGVAEVGNEFSKCANGVGVPGGGFGPNGEIMKRLPNIASDIRNGTGPTNDVFGNKGWMQKTLGFHL